MSTTSLARCFTETLALLFVIQALSQPMMAQDFQLYDKLKEFNSKVTLADTSEHLVLSLPDPELCRQEERSRLKASDELVSLVQQNDPEIKKRETITVRIVDDDLDYSQEIIFYYMRNPKSQKWERLKRGSEGWKRLEAMNIPLERMRFNPETRRAFIQEENADLVFLYLESDQARLMKPESSLGKETLDEKALFDYINTFGGNKDLAVVIIDKLLRFSGDELLKKKVDELELRFRKAKFKRVVFQLASGSGRPIYRDTRF